MSPEEPEPRERSGAHPARRPRTGTEPRTARSPLRLRMLLNAVFLPVVLAATVLFALWAANSSPSGVPGPAALTGLAVACGVLALVAAVDGVVVRRRMRQERDGRPS
ncbi:DUF6343 family protein [Streptomyces sp. NPDC059861]|uniref:DUF6343 family protein n=1 Tax=Streptomyces sp. NPDC059861 TaxID=3346974 RepID=UPI00364D90A3